MRRALRPRVSSWGVVHIRQSFDRSPPRFDPMVGIDAAHRLAEVDQHLPPRDAPSLDDGVLQLVVGELGHIDAVGGRSSLAQRVRERDGRNGEAARLR